MRARGRPVAVALVACLALGAPVALASGRLPIPAASKRSAAFAKRTCVNDRLCVRSGVLNCHRQGATTVLCRIYDERRTRVQGRYRCDRLIRVSLKPRARRIPITGLGRWHC